MLGFWLRQSGDALRERAERELSIGLGHSVRVAQVAARIAAGLPALELDAIEIDAPESALRFDAIRARAAWSTSWLRGEPELALTLRGDSGSADLQLWPRAPGSLRGTLGDLDLRVLALATPELRVSGRSSAQLDLSDLGTLPQGRIELDAAQGALQLPALPLPIRFDRLALSAELGAKGEWLQLRDGELIGPDLRARFAGGIGAGAQLETAPLELRAELEIGAALAPLAELAGIALSEEGRATLRVRGTLAAPELR
jgi:type II secretion system protein N